MKKFLYFALAFAAVLAATFAFGHVSHGLVGLAALAPVMPSFMGRRLLDRAIKFDNGTFGQGIAWLHDVLYDRLILDANTPAQTSLFRNKAGDQRNGVVLTLADTNNISTQVPTKQKWMLWSLKVTYQGIAARTDLLVQAMLNFYRQTQITLTINSLASQFNLPLAHFLPGEQFVSAPAATINSRYPQGSSDEKWELRIPIVLEENAVWSLDVNCLTAPVAGIYGDYVLFSFDREMYRAGI